jgi:hypothetical protein
MKKYISIIIIMILTIAIKSTSAQYPDDPIGRNKTTMYLGDKNTEKYQAEIDLLDKQIKNYEKQKKSELKALEKKSKKVPKEDNSNDLSSLLDTTDENVSTSGLPEEKISIKYDIIIKKLTDQKLEITEKMVNSNGNYLASNTSSLREASYLYLTDKGKNINNSNTLTTTPNNNGTMSMYVYNASKNKTIKILNGPFAGVTLTPGQKSQMAPVTVGLFEIEYNEYLTGSNYVKNVKANFPIDINGADYIKIFDRY